MKQYNNIAAAIADLEKKGFKHRWQYDEGQLFHPLSQQPKTATELSINAFHRFQDPIITEDSVVVYEIVSDQDERGLLIVRYNNDIDLGLIRFLDGLPIKQQKE